MRGLLAFVIFFSISTFSFSYATATSIDSLCVFEARWHMFIINDISEDITINVRSQGHGLGKETLPYQENYDWDFCENGKIEFSGDFWWNSKISKFDVI
ncbi:unnamed protein product [Lactuca virosa]|uniref:S-protein homolog n=1 Tax=Lactuca virosa TaxID=75947 RepID=A0AAU9MN19_9ASTR|nr:unnamed protein product [Lactuca virosa]